MHATATTTASGPVRAPDRLAALCDPGSLRMLDSGGWSGVAVRAAQARVAGRPVVVWAQDRSVRAGTLGPDEADVLVAALRLALSSRLPVIGLVDSGGARLQEGVGALDGYARVFAAQVLLAHAGVPQISIVLGGSAGGASYSPALTDFVIQLRSAAMFLTGPRVVREALGEHVSADELGGARVHARNGVAHLVADTEPEAFALARRLLELLAPGLPARSAARRFPARRPDPSSSVPTAPRAVYDIRTVIEALADDGDVLELAPRWARNVVTAFARLDGRPVAVVANQPRHLGGALDVEGSRKAAWFVGRCAALGLPLVVLVDTPGFLPGRRQESDGVIRAGAGLVEAFVLAGATVPVVTVVLRRSTGGAFIAMGSRGLGAGRVLAWRGARIGIMGGREASEVIHARRLADAAEPEAERRVLAEAYEAEHLDAEAAVAAGAVDAVISPPQTRERLIAALDEASPAGASR